MDTDTYDACPRHTQDGVGIEQVIFTVPVVDNKKNNKTETTQNNT